jgi:hypothetical protein
MDATGAPLVDARAIKQVSTFVLRGDQVKALRTAGEWQRGVTPPDRCA